MNYDYAKEKLECLLRDLEHYTGEEFWRQMARISSGATGLENPEDLLKNKNNPIDNKCSLGVGCEDVGICYADSVGAPDKCGRLDNG